MNMDIQIRTNRQRGLNLIGENLHGANLEGAFLNEANLEGANLEGANLRRANLGLANLAGANLAGANLQRANLGLANLRIANLRGVFLEGADLGHAQLGHADLSNADLGHADLERANLASANLAGANLTNANLTNSSLQRANLAGANLTNANLRGAFLQGANLRGANLEGANLERAFLEDANLEGANFEGANLEDVIGYQRVATPPAGVAYEVHNAFTTFQLKKPDYLAIIDQPNFKGSVAEFIKFIQDIFNSNIQQVFPGDNNKLEQFNSVFEKSKNYLSGNPEEQQLIYKSITFAFSQDNEFKEQYISTFLDETCNAYAGSGDNTSCVKGILERYVLSVGNAVQILCSDGCENETYKKLDILLNPKFNVEDAASSWWENESVKTDIINMDTSTRKKNFIDYLTSESNRLGSANAETKTKIESYANLIDYSFAELQLGGRKSRKSKKSRKSRKYVRKNL